MIKSFSNLVAKSAFIALLFGLSTSNTFAANPSNIKVNLHNGGGYVAGLFYKKVGASEYERAGNWLSLGGHSSTPVVAKGSNFCVSIVVMAGLAYSNYYYNSNGNTPEWLNEPVGNANLSFYGDLLFSGPKWYYNGTQSAGLIDYRTGITQNKPCIG